jgi:superoxide dismutase, Fe-Mn family
MAFTLPPLGYDYAALEPHIDARTMEIHHTKHHQAYITNLNAAIEKTPELQDKSLEWLLQNLPSAPESVRNAVRNNGGGHWNHTFFWQIIGPNGGGEPSGAVADAIKSSFGEFSKLKEQLNASGLARFGSGWAWVVAGKGGKLTIESTPNQDTPVSEKKTPILGVDVWEHAYYLKYQNRRADYLAAWWNVVNWGEVAKRLESAR